MIKIRLSIIPSLYEDIVSFNRSYPDGKYILFRVSLGENTTLALLTSTAYSNQLFYIW